MKMLKVSLITCLSMMILISTIQAQNSPIANNEGRSFTMTVIGGANELLRALEGEIKPIYEVDGKRVDESQLGIFPDDIKSVGILKSEAARDKYGEEGKYGAVHIYTFKGNGPDPAKMLNVDPLEREKELWKASANTRKNSTWDDFLLIVDGVKSNKPFSEFGFKNVKEIKITAEEDQMLKYEMGEKRGLIFVTTKDNN
ncbi:hypothetical protein [Peijinzhouia sedimentorum]